MSEKNNAKAAVEGDETAVAEKAAVGRKMVTDPELQALSRIGTEMEKLPTAARQRVLAYLNSRFQPSPTYPGGGTMPEDFDHDRH